MDESNREALRKVAAGLVAKSKEEKVSADARQKSEEVLLRAELAAHERLAQLVDEIAESLQAELLINKRQAGGLSALALPIIWQWSLRDAIGPRGRRPHVAGEVFSDSTGRLHVRLGRGSDPDHEPIALLDAELETKLARQVVELLATP